MKLTFITLAPLSSRAGHLARLSLTLEYLLASHDIQIICLGTQPDDIETQTKYRKAIFIHMPICFSGWEALGAKNIAQSLLTIAGKFDSDLTILQMEVWDLARELSVAFRGQKSSFAVMMHAMPFLGSPLNPSGDFQKDVLLYANSGIQEYRKNYILNHYTEAKTIFRDLNVIANNRTVAHYIKTYFPELPLFELQPFLVAKVYRSDLKFDLSYDFAYMARMERGKGLEYLHEILIKISEHAGRKIKVLVLGRADDLESKDELKRLESYKGEEFSIDYKGWASESDKARLLPRCGAFLYPSYYDNYPTVLNEALGFGLPCTVWDVPFSKLNYSTPAVKKVKLGDSSAFAAVSWKLLVDRGEMKEAALKFADSFSSSMEAAEADVKVYRKIIEHDRT